MLLARPRRESIQYITLLYDALNLALNLDRIQAWDIQSNQLLFNWSLPDQYDGLKKGISSRTYHLGQAITCAP
jgi:hypothetical protein